MQPHNVYTKRRARTALCLTACCLLGATALAGCATTAPRQPIPQAFKEPCKGPEDNVKTIADLAAFSVRQEVALQDCEAKRVGLVSLIDKPAGKPWWRFW